jgi:hypothetical protein
VIAAGLATLLALAAPPVRVVPLRVLDDRCPSGAEVEQALASMIAPSRSSRDVARLDPSPGKLRVVLVDTEGVVIAERTLDGRGSCAELGRMAAIVIASWESDVHPEFVRAQAELPPRDRPAPSVAAYEIAAGVSLGQADKLAAGASLGASWFPHGVGFGLSLLGAGETTRPIAVGSYEARWRRWTASLELARRWGRGGLALDAHAGPTLGWVTTEGVDYPQNRSDSGISFGGTAGLRSSWWTSRHAALWLDLRGFYFPLADSVYGVAATRDEASLPRWGAIASFGVALGRATAIR